MEVVTMTIKELENKFPPIGALAQHSLSGVKDLMKEILTKLYVDEDKMSCWQIIFSQSKANGCSYRGEALPHIKWHWPRDTWFQEQLDLHLKGLEFPAHQAKN
jgi:hypothetical protein